MATPRRNHCVPAPWGAQVEQIVWERSRSGKPRRRRLDRPLLIHDPGWDWDGSRILFSKRSVVSDSDEEECTREFQEQLQEDAHYPILLGSTHGTLSLLDIARYQVTKRCNKARSGLDDFEVIRVPKVVPAPEEDPDLGDGWNLGDWEKLDAPRFRRTYSEVAQGFVDGKDPPIMPGYSQFALSRTEDDSWECL